MEMYVKRRAVRSRWQRTIERQYGLALRVAHPPHPQGFSSVAEFKLQEVIHGSPQFEDRRSLTEAADYRTVKRILSL
jgi:hypothetical protein